MQVPVQGEPFFELRMQKKAGTGGAAQHAENGPLPPYAKSRHGTVASAHGSVQPQIRSPKDLISNPFAGVRSCTGPGLSGGLPWGGVRTRTPKDLISNPEFRGIRGSGQTPGAGPVTGDCSLDQC